MRLQCHVLRLFFFLARRSFLFRLTGRRGRYNTAESTSQRRDPPFREQESHMSGLFSKLIDFMDKEEWKYEILEGETTIRFHFKTKTGRLLCFGDVEEDKQFVLFYSYLPVNVPEDKLIEIAEFLTRANRGIRIGNFEMDYDTGEICYKTSIDIEGGDLTHKVMDNLLRANLSTTDRYFRGIMEVIFGDKAPTEAIQTIEKPNARRNADDETSELDDEDEDLDDDDDDEDEEEDFDDDISLDDEELLRDDDEERGRRN